MSLVTVNPTYGYASVTVFEISCIATFNDPERLPLHYQFFAKSGQIKELLSGWGLASTQSVTLQRNGTVVVGVRVRDASGSISKIESNFQKIIDIFFQQSK